MTTTRPTVFVIDDDEGTRDSLRVLLESVDLRVETFASAGEFLEGWETGTSGCLLLDVRVPGMTGLELLRRLKDYDIGIPVCIVTGHGDVEMAVEAMRAGAIDFIAKPFRPQRLLDAVQRCLAEDRRRRQERARGEDARARLAPLTPRERQVMELVVVGRTSKMIARELGISPKTVHIYRSRIRKKAGCDSVADLVMLAKFSGAWGKPNSP